MTMRIVRNLWKEWGLCAHCGGWPLVTPTRCISHSPKNFAVVESGRPGSLDASRASHVVSPLNDPGIPQLGASLAKPEQCSGTMSADNGTAKTFSSDEQKSAAQAHAGRINNQPERPA